MLPLYDGLRWPDDGVRDRTASASSIFVQDNVSADNRYML